VLGPGSQRFLNLFLIRAVGFAHGKNSLKHPNRPFLRASLEPRLMFFCLGYTNALPVKTTKKNLHWKTLGHCNHRPEHEYVNCSAILKLNANRILPFIFGPTASLVHGANQQGNGRQ
jgi:hypothetical protein